MVDPDRREKGRIDPHKQNKKGLSTKTLFLAHSPHPLNPAPHIHPLHPYLLFLFNIPTATTHTPIQDFPLPSSLLLRHHSPLPSFSSLSQLTTHHQHQMCDQEWLKKAMADDSVVVELLLRLHQAKPPPSAPMTTSSCLRLDWTVRQRRSRHLGAEKKAEPTRASPTTPLSWSGATSASGGGAADGYEESSHPAKPLQSSRSKVTNPSETTTTKRSRRKKTLAELKEEENLLLKERKSLESELASLHLIVEKHRAMNESLKRMKLDLESQHTFKTATTSVDSEKTIFDQHLLVKAQRQASNSVSQTSVTHKVFHDVSPFCLSNASTKAQEISDQEASFLLPDLNLPVE